MKNKMKKNVIKIGFIYISMFIILISYLSYFVIAKSEDIVIHAHNRRMDPLEKEVIRGDILSSNGKIIAKTIDDGGDTLRIYTENNKYAHVVGYTQKGKTGVEASANIELLRPNYNLESIFKRAFYGDKFQGRDVVLTIDDALQETAYNALGNNKGAIVAIEPSTGKIKAFVSKPDFDPNKILENWETLIADDVNAPLVNRGASGLYPPGSIFKIVTSSAFLKKEGVESDLLYRCEGQITTDDNTIRCFNNKAHGEIDLTNAFAKSCNTYFINMGKNIGEKSLRNTGEKLLFNKNLPLSMEYSKSKLLKGENILETELAATYIGQGRTLVTPIHMAMITSAIANEGTLMKPYIVDYSKDKKGNVKTKNLPKYFGEIIEPDIAKRLESDMVEVVKNGTGGKAAVSNMYVGGKTGTAENEGQKDHSWFVGFAGKETAEISFAIIIENAGRDVSASQVAHNIIKEYQRNK